jgi:cyclopropane-fatty-acyl-phospholipid synthase
MKRMQDEMAAAAGSGAAHPPLEGRGCINRVLTDIKDREDSAELTLPHRKRHGRSTKNGAVDLSKGANAATAEPIGGLARLLDRIVVFGTLTVIDPAGRAHVFGPGSEPAVTVRIRDTATLLRIWLNPSLAVGEAYMDGGLTIERGTLRDFLSICVNASEVLDSHPLRAAASKCSRPLRFFQQHNPIRRARANVAHHYDLSGLLYDLFLDADRQYSCAYFPDGSETLEEAQAKKKRHIAAKLLVEPGMAVLDIGSGWGGLAIDLARRGARVDGITLSHEQWKLSRERAEAAGLGDRARFHLRDYREERGSYDRIVSVGMFEHVGIGSYDTFFRTVRQALRPDGVALVHAIGRMERPGTTNAWLRKYIFPGGYCPALSEVLAAVERTGLWVTDIEILRLHYAETLRHWFMRFEANREGAKLLYDERFCRMWEFYLAACEMAFRYGRMMVFQIQLACSRHAVPLSRDYITDVERQQERPVLQQPA